ncbi:hypothetical protein M2451_000857 [Dysgonomonas sp. PFB1-18]|nr:hypothetical protein [Dysgonomonas sp. PF1-14]MDH6338047.1 hypothetical protein [Dysgonomonas sp. PF1-16]MDH6379544.1 hypothetical protein [Dysgonomonas sp. PFB1-18]MDH6396874.1 hypothetical protein [Dysgonomonas sp. PF1-23]
MERKLFKNAQHTQHKVYHSKIHNPKTTNLSNCLNLLVIQLHLGDVVYIDYARAMHTQTSPTADTPRTISWSVLSEIYLSVYVSSHSRLRRAGELFHLQVLPQSFVRSFTASIPFRAIINRRMDTIFRQVYSLRAFKFLSDKTM